MMLTTDSGQREAFFLPLWGSQNLQVGPTGTGEAAYLDMQLELRERSSRSWAGRDATAGRKGRERLPR